MKKFGILMLTAMMMLSLIACPEVTTETVAPAQEAFDAAGNPANINGTWTGTVSENDTDVAGFLTLNEGTFTKTTITTPTPTKIVVNELAGSDTVTTETWYDTKTTTVVTNVVVQANGSFVSTTTTTETWAERAAAPADTATMIYKNGDPQATNAILGGVQTTVDTVTYTVAYNTNTKLFNTTTVTKQAITYTGSRFLTGFDNSTDTTTINSVDQTKVTVDTKITAAIAGLTKTVKATTGTFTKKTNIVETWTYVIKADGTYTKTIVVTETQNATPATATEAEVLAGTRTKTTVETGKVVVIISGGTSFALSKRTMYFAGTQTTVTTIATGDLIGSTDGFYSYYGTSKVDENKDIAVNYTYTYDIVGKAIVLQSATSYIFFKQ